MSMPSSPNDGQSGRKEFFRSGLNQQPLYQQQQQQQQQIQHQHQLTLQQQPFMNNNNNITLQQQQAPLLQPQQTTAGLNTATTVTAVQQPPPPPAQYLHWANPLVGGAPFLQSTTQPQRGTVPPTHQQQQQHFNDFLFNIQAQAVYAAAAAAVPPPPPPSAQPSQVGSPSSPQETYSVLRVGNGNFLKIYHCAENAMSPLPGETSFTPMAPYNQPQTAAFHHINTQATAAVPTALQQQQQQQPSQTQTSGSDNSPASPQAFNSYELFSSSTFTQLPTAEMPPLLLLGPTTQLPPLATDDFTDNEQNLKQLSNIGTKNMIIHNMPSNWAGNNNPTTGPLCAQFEKRQNETLDLDNSSTSLANIEAPTATTTTTTATETPNNNYSANSDTLKNNATLDNTLSAHITIQQGPSVKSFTATPNILPATNQTTITKNTEIPRQEAPKKRIVAEVKPMRMTYSDVLSKFNNQTQNSQQQQIQNNLNNNTLTTNAAVNIATTVANRQQQKASKLDTNSNNVRRNGCGDDTITAPSSTIRSSSSKKSPTHENKENQQSQQQQLINNKLNYNNQKRSSSSTVINNGHNTSNSLNVNNNNNNNNNNSSSISKTSSTTTIQKNSINNSKNNINNNNSNYNTNDNPSLKKPRSNKNSDNNQSNSGVKSNSSEQQRGTAKNNVNQAPNQTSPTSNVYNSTNNTYGRKLTKSSNSGNTSSSTGQSRSRYQNNSNASYSYSSTKRSRNNSSYGTSSSSFNNSLLTNGSGSNRNYELAKRFLQAWYTYTMKILTWLFYLVYDIVVLGCSILYERLTYAFECGKAYGTQLHKDLKQNSNKPSIWFKNYCRKFDGKFSKTSKWAFWRRFYKKKPPETASESIKTGRLPATGEEAMYQLLNCKGKDAYSILGVPPNSSPEQIRKHYKKIAVLVHPDKNKQAGAEEAFKVLQRAFELIGEPENRLAYDQSLAEALHAEKAWTELHDLLSQLQTKITEAANTIRCSTCGLRHPRRITDRPHYAARECASCKIRHSAREGDIWAETSLLGLRWKYLALMEGKVYDITEWANCQKGALAHLEPNSHMVQYRIVRGAQQQQQQQQQQQHQQKQQSHQQQQQHHQKQHTGSQYTSGGGVGGKFKRDTTIPPSEASLHEFLDNLYSGQHPQQQQNTSAYAGSSRRRNRRN